MQKDYWHQKWQSNEIEFNQLQPNVLLQRYFNLLNLKARARVFVPLCGKSIDMLWLANQGYDVVGIDLSPIACEAFFNENNILANVTRTDNVIIFQGEKITLLSGDFFQLSKKMLGEIDVVYDRAALIALPGDLRQSYAKYLIKLLEPGTQLLLITTSYNQNEMPGPPFSVGEEEVMELYGAQCTIKQLYNKSVKTIPAHFQIKGLFHINEQAYILNYNSIR